MFKRIVGIVSLFLLLASNAVMCGCSREEENDISVFGTVMNGTTPKSGVTIQIDLDGYTVGQTVSGSDGFYEITFSGNSSSSGKVKATNSWYQNGLGGGQRHQYVEIPFSLERSSKVQIDINFEGVPIT